MNKSRKSVVLSSICTKLAILMVIGIVATAPALIGRYLDYTSEGSGILVSMMNIVYLGSVPVFISLYSLDRILVSIKKQEVFSEKNVTYLRRISWSCFLIAGILVASRLHYVSFIIIAVMTAFFGLIIWVVKEIFQEVVSTRGEEQYGK